MIARNDNHNQHIYAYEHEPKLHKRNHKDQADITFVVIILASNGHPITDRNKAGFCGFFSKKKRGKSR
jgi:hypothetical protein